MDDVVVRLMVAGAIVIVGLGIAGVAGARRRRRSARAPIDLTGLSGRVLFFSDSRCGSCHAMRRRLERLGVPFDEVAHDHEPEFLRGIGVVAVPLVVVRDTAGTEVGRIAGRGRLGELGRLVRRAGLEIPR